MALTIVAGTGPGEVGRFEVCDASSAPTRAANATSSALAKNIPKWMIPTEMIASTTTTINISTVRPPGLRWNLRGAAFRFIHHSKRHSEVVGFELQAACRRHRAVLPLGRVALPPLRVAENQPGA